LGRPKHSRNEAGEPYEEEVMDSRQGVVLQLEGLGMGITTPSHKKYACYEMSQRASDMDEFFG
jgi:hypothetical protein